MRTKGDQVQEFLTYELSGCVMSKYRITDLDGDSPPVEDIELSFTKLVVTHTGYDENDKMGSPIRAGYDLAAASVV